MSGRIFLDTNVLVYAFDRGERRKQRRAWEILEQARADTVAVISTQVLQEFYVIVTRKLKRPLPEADAEAAVIRLAELPVVQVDTQMIVGAVHLSREHQLSLWDSLILRAAVAGGCDRVLTEDLQDGFVVDGLTVVDPFAAT